MTRRLARPVRWVVLVPVAVFALAACGLSANPAPNRLAAEDVPFGLLDPPTSTTAAAPTTVPPQSSQTVQVYFVRDKRLVAVERELPVPTTAFDLVSELLDGPTEAEASKGLRTAIATGTQLLSATVVDRGVVTDFSGEFGNIQGEDQILAVAQVVFTVTGLDGVTGVTFRLDGKAVDVQRGDGTIRPGPVGRLSFPAQKPVP